MKLAFIFLAVLSSAYGYNILCIQNVPSKSHFHLMKGLVYPLLEAGHQVTWITTYPGTKPVQNLTYIDVSHLQALVDYIDMSNNRFNGIAMVKEFAWNISRGALETPAVRNVLMKDRFDAVITEWFFSDVDAGFAAVLQAPWIQLSGMVFHLHLEHLVDTVRSVPVIPSQGNDFEIPMTLWQRIKNTISFLFFTYHNTLDQTPRKNYESYFTPIAEARGVPLPPFSEALHNTSILLVNQHSSFAPAQPTPPNVVDIAGYHIDENVPQLPKDLQQLLDSSPQGVVYFSMGSVLKSSAQFPEQTKKDLISMFAAMPYTVLWKFEEELKDLPKNVHIRPWMPQSSILSHPNVKAFITHGGLLSTLESLHFGVPIIAIPVFGDQPGNARRSVRAGHALMVELNPTELAGKLKIALNEMLNNDKYYNRAKYISKLFRNRPVSNKKLIQHYVELAIESKGAYHLRSKSLLYSWYQLWMLDQLALLVLALYVILRVLKKIVSLFSKKENVARGKKEKRN